MNRKDWRQGRYRGFDFTTTPAGKGKMLVHSHWSGKTTVLTSSDLSLLFSCQRFETLASHAETYCRQRKMEKLTSQKDLLSKLFRSLLDYAAQEGIELPIRKKETEPHQQQLQQWADEGFLVSEQELQKK